MGRGIRNHLGSFCYMYPAMLQLPHEQKKVRKIVLASLQIFTMGWQQLGHLPLTVQYLPLHE